MTHRLPIAPLALIVPLVLATAPPAAAEIGVDEESIRLGMVNVQSGPASALGQGMLAGASAVFDDVNARGGIHGRRIELLVADDGYEPEQAIDETLYMIEDEEVFALFGYVGTPTANAVLPIVSELDVPLVGLFTGAGTLRSPLTPEVFNVRASYDDEAEAMVAHFLANGAENVAVFYQDDGFGKAVLSGATKALARRGMDVHATGTFPRNTVAVKSGLAEMLRSAPDAIVMVGTYAPLAEFVRQGRAAGLESQLATVSFVGTGNLVAALGDTGEGVIITQVMPYPFDDRLRVVSDCRRLLDEHGGGALDYINLEGCLSAKVLVEALARAGEALDRDALTDALESMAAHDLGGVTVGYSPTDHQGMSEIYVTEVHDGGVRLVGEALRISDAD